MGVTFSYGQYADLPILMYETWSYVCLPKKEKKVNMFVCIKSRLPKGVASG